MSKVRQTPINPPGSKYNSKASKPSIAASKQPLSQEFISSSDDEAEADTGPPQSTKNRKSGKIKKQNAPVIIGVHRPKANGVVKKTQVPLPKHNSVPKTVVNEELESSSSDSDESDDDNVEDQEYPSGQIAGEELVDDDSEASSSNSDSSSSESDDEASATPALSSAKERPTPSQSHTIEFRPVQPFIPPKGFTAVSTPLNTTSRPTQIFENIEGKQIWHITAPAGVAMAQLKELAMAKAMAGDSIITQKDVDYCFAKKESEEGMREVLIPARTGYKAVSTRISRTLHLEQIITLPNLDLGRPDLTTGSEATASITRSTIRAPRPQVKGLKMRYFHSGFGDREPGTIGWSDSEDNENSDAPATSSLGVAKGTQVFEKPQKRKHADEVNGLERLESPTKKHKNHRSPEELKKREEKKARKEKKREKMQAKS